MEQGSHGVAWVGIDSGSDFAEAVVVTVLRTVMGTKRKELSRFVVAVRFVFGTKYGK
jgi:hypothetical protein